MTVQGPVKQSQPDGMSHRGGGGGMLWHAGLTWAGQGAGWQAGLCCTASDLYPIQTVSAAVMALLFPSVRCSVGVSGRTLSSSSTYRKAVGRRWS